MIKIRRCKLGLLARLGSDKRGVAFVEFALIAPVMIAFYFGCAEFCLALMADKRASHTSAIVGDLVAQGTTLSSADVNDFFLAGRAALAPFQVTPLRIRVSQVERLANGAYEIDWSCTKNWTRRSPTQVGGLPPNYVLRGQRFLFAESSYSYASPVNAWLPDLTQFDSQMPYRIRQVDFIGRVGGGEFTNANCPGEGW